MKLLYVTIGELATEEIDLADAASMSAGLARVKRVGVYFPASPQQSERARGNDGIGLFV